MKNLRTLQTGIVLFVCLMGLQAAAVPDSVTLQTRILKPDGTALEATAVSYQVTTVDPLGTCVLYAERFNNLNMLGSGGVSISNLGAGTLVYSATGAGYSTIFDNSAASFNCQAGGTYTPAVTDRRFLVIQFFDGSTAGWQTLPSIAVNSVPFAHYAGNSTKLGGHPLADFTLKSNFPDCNTSGKVLTYNGSAFTCISPSTGGGTVTNITSANSYLTVATGTTTPALTVNVGTAANTLAAGDDSRIVGAAQKPNNLSDLASATTARTNLGLGSAAVLSVGTAAGTVAAGNDSRITGGVQQTAYNADITSVIDSTCTAASSAKWNVALDTWTCVAIGSLDAAAITTGTIAASRLPASATFWNDAGAGKINYSGGNVGIGNANPVVAFDVQGQIRSRTADVTALTTIDWNSGNTLYTSDSCQSYTLTNLADGGSYTLIVKGATSAQCLFAATGLTFHYTPSNAPTNAGTHAIFTFLRGGNDVYVSWTTGL